MAFVSSFNVLSLAQLRFFILTCNRLVGWIGCVQEGGKVLHFDQLQIVIYWISWLELLVEEISKVRRLDAEELK